MCYKDSKPIVGRKTSDLIFSCKFTKINNILSCSYLRGLINFHNNPMELEELLKQFHE